MHEFSLFYYEKLKINKNAVKVLYLESINKEILHIMTKKNFLARYSRSIMVSNLNPFWHPPLLNPAFATDNLTADWASVGYVIADS